ncbi:YadA family autotransporter adhesin [Paraburkholderia rhizosphaerae]|uniref:Autotransporter adhesin n=1 Tax=Paraburkholderia rhizosphaerae TaxID=480658 RepID=A0A4R8LYK4_9BURK|nr:YadA-like family protein [Paraburkholderia rhizosphaerae]TDY53358.1 autotransporter adhesin [Paraburkholderia rhizosphaerae]
MNKNHRTERVGPKPTPIHVAAIEIGEDRTDQSRSRTTVTASIAMIALSLAGLSAPATSLASAITIADTDKATGQNCTTSNAGSGTWSVVGGCFANAGVKDAAHNLAETVVGAYGYVPANVSFASGFGFSNQTYAYFGSSIGAAAYVASGAKNSVALGTGSVATEANTVSLGRVGDNPLKGAYGDSGDGNSSDTAALNQNLTGTLTRRLTNMSAGINNTDAVNVGQLKAAGLAIDTSGNPTNAFVAYDDTTKARVTLAGGTAGTTITNLAPGVVSAGSRDAINGSQLYNSASSIASALGGGSIVNGEGGITMPRYNVGGDTVIGVDGAVDALDQRITDASSAAADISSKLKYIKFGETTAQDATASGVNAVAIGGFAQATGDNSLAIGANARATGVNSIAIGAGSSTNLNNTFAVGSNTAKRRIVNVADAVNYSDAVTLGQMNAAIAAAIPTSGGDVSNGTLLRASAVRASAGAAPQAALSDSLAYDSEAHDRVTLGGVGSNGHVRLTNLQDADLTATSTDAVTGEQLFATNQQVAALGQAVQNFGANGTTYISASTVSGAATAAGSNSLAVGGGAKASGNDSTALGDRAQAAGSASVALGSQASATANNSVALGANSVASRDNTVSVGAPGAERQIVNIAAGVQGSDAVNVNQLNAAVAHTNQQISGLQGQINDVAKGANAGTAAAMAVAGLPQPTQPGKAMVAFAGARYGGQSGAAFGASYVTQNNKFVVKLSGNTSTNGNVGVVAGAGFQW